MSDRMRLALSLMLGGLLVAVSTLRPDPPSESQVFAAVAPSVGLIAHAVKLQVLVDGQKVHEQRGYVVSSGTVVRSDRRGSYLLTVAHGIDLTYLEEELNGPTRQLGFRLGFRADSGLQDISAVVEGIRSHFAGRRWLVRLVWKKEMRVDFQWQQIFKIPGRAVLVDRHGTGMDLALVWVPTRGLPAVPLSVDRILKPGDPVMAFGNPLGVFGVPQRGIVAVPQERDYEAPAWRRLYTFSLPSFPGMSGSGVLSARGAILAVLKGGAGENFTLGIPAHIVRDWLRGNGFSLD